MRRTYKTLKKHWCIYLCHFVVNVSLCLHVANDNLSNMEIEVTAAQLRIGFPLCFLYVLSVHVGKELDWIICRYEYIVQSLLLLLILGRICEVYMLIASSWTHFCDSYTTLHPTSVLFNHISVREPPHIYFLFHSLLSGLWADKKAISPCDSHSFVCCCSLSVWDLFASRRAIRFAKFSTPIASLKKTPFSRTRKTSSQS